MNAMATIYPIRLYGDPILRRRALPVEAFDGIPELAENLFETMFEAGGVGLAAPQVGISRRLFVAAEYLDEEEEAEDTPLKSRVKQLYVMVNPVITYREGHQVGTEGCLSLPGLYSDEVPRDLRVRVQYQDEYGEPKVLEAEGYLARVIQHELDHLEGKLFIDRLPPEARRAFINEHRAELAEMQRRARALIKELKEA
ncbi:Peptide deformylase [Marinithermus hydrothermalis DSM 14884]|uniref:Peptide deformylase n=2 Tax=Marinithermus TaxID=186191 RepID=F2NR12_MARHT|nr:Peptide deformylase [Marinithermus hydrothermalis DSM 14884]